MQRVCMVRCRSKTELELFLEYLEVNTQYRWNIGDKPTNSVYWTEGYQQILYLYPYDYRLTHSDYRDYDDIDRAIRSHEEDYNVTYYDTPEEYMGISGIEIKTDILTDFLKGGTK